MNLGYSSLNCQNIGRIYVFFVDQDQADVTRNGKAQVIQGISILRLRWVIIETDLKLKLIVCLHVNKLFFYLVVSMLMNIELDNF